MSFIRCLASKLIVFYWVSEYISRKKQAEVYASKILVCSSIKESHFSENCECWPTNYYRKSHFFLFSLQVIG